MKLLIIIDQEGCANVTPKQTSHLRSINMIAEFENFVHTVPHDWDIDVLDCHDNGLTLQSIKNKYPQIHFIAQIWNFNINIDYNLAILLGFHAACDIKSPFSHTFRTEIIETQLNGANVGEVTLLVRWLQSHNIPVAFVHGEPELEEEVNKLNIPFTPNSLNPRFSINNVHQTCYHDISQVKIRLINDKLLEAFPSTIFKIKNNYLVFDNISHYLSKLSEVSIFLNAARNYYIMYIKNLFNKIKWNYTREDINKLNDNRLNDILSNTNIFTVSIDDIKYLQTKLKIN